MIEILELTRSYESRVYKQIQHIAMSTNANVDMQVLIVTQKPRDMRDQQPTGLTMNSLDRRTHIP